MAEYIERDALCAHCGAREINACSDECEVFNAPAADVVKVVRCKDCKHEGNPMACPMCQEEYYFNEDDGGDYYTVDRTVEDGFCHAGERWDGNG